MNKQEKLARAAALFDQAKTLIDDPNATDEQKAHIPAILGEARKLKGEVELLGQIDNEAKGLLERERAAAEAERKSGGGGEAKFSYFGEFLEAAHAKIGGTGNDPRLQSFMDDPEPSTHTRTGRKDLSGAQGSTGGYLIPEEFRAQLLAVMAERSIVRSRATVIPMRRRAVKIPALQQNADLEAGVPRWFGGLEFRWIEEAQEKPASDPVFRQIELVAKKLAGYTRSSDELLDDAGISLEAFLSGPMGFAGGVAWMEDWAFLHGTGVGQPLGVYNSPAVLTVERDTDNAIEYKDLITMMASLLPSANAVWIASQSAMAGLLGMTGPSGNASYLWGNAVNGVPNSLLGLPIVFSEKAPALGNTGDIGLFDFSYYLIGDRQATTVESTKYDRWRYDQTSWRVVHRVDGQPWVTAALEYQDGETTVSPFVLLGEWLS